jgi:activator of 2-hydroxyglutaryl-CoA dehydratase
MNLHFAAKPWRLAMAILADFGTSWTKVLDTASGRRKIAPTKDMADISAELATGHNTQRRALRSVNELIALGDGAMHLVDDNAFTVLDVGSRDVKYVRFDSGRVSEMNWSAKCGAMTGFTLELILKYFEIDPASVEKGDSVMGITCGVLGMEQLFEQIASGGAPERAVANFTRGLAVNAYRFIGQPKRFYLSGGMCDNSLFIRSFPEGVEVLPLGRFVLVEGLRKELDNDE